ncbi:bifunctional alpha,alpha-trehalose-phosphate synthase (UDP-forming)/trehalose-phosphatase [candidate division TA06 bacterium]|uniref:Alpha,alpha-trehalose-phosphate synthase n=1 Tax=candidate division TA06 bacterium TaxID=2250710 RepID=A0A523UPD3_UNCT6|nr:MAG: bifunctional alpha,alpha-trehalose-phosphate synthase (UDP-forming)/trehalose-phosphatase [candidate division TA06 bacterium]
MQRLLIVSNRLPVSVEKRKGIVQYNDSVGGVATGLSTFHKSHHSIWVGWPGIPAEKIKEERKSIENKLISQYNCYPVFLNHSTIEKYYRGYSNRTIWPLFHYFTQHAIYDKSLWEEYEEANKVFCDAVAEVQEKGDIIWVHDYHLMLLPRLLRERIPDATIGVFFHIPFPSSELFRLLPQRKEILDGLLGADLIGFHTYDYVNHFLSSVRRLSGYEHSYGQISVGERTVRVDSFPMGIDYARFSKAFQDRNVKREMAKYLKRLGKQRVILSIDRLDYTKGITQRLEAFSVFLGRNPDYRGKITLVLVAVPSRTQVDTYKQLKKQVDELVGRINGEYGTIDWTPIWYMYRSLPFASLASLYSIADVCLVTPLRDGMNLIAKEYVATRRDGKGVLILSEMAGASKELGEAIIINANNEVEIAGALEQALTMPESEQTDRNRIMQERLQRYNIVRWAKDFLGRLVDTKELQKELQARRLSVVMTAKLRSDYQRSKRRLLLLDYDGTLIPFRERPEEAAPDHGLLALLEKLAEDEKNEVVIISGRDRASLQNWFGTLDLGLVSEHGAWVKKKKEGWKTIEPLTDEWKEKIRPLLELHVDRTPGAFIEEKEFSIAWHYRRADPGIGETRAGELIDNLLSLTKNLNLQILRGNKVVDIKTAGISKERAASQWIPKEEWEFIMAIGDDLTDEDIFAALPDDAYSIKVGFTPSVAKYNLDSPGDVLLLLGELITDGPPET